MPVIRIKVKSPDSRFAALDVNNKYKVLVEGKDAVVVATEARKLNIPFSMMFIPEKNKRHIY